MVGMSNTDKTTVVADYVRNEGSTHNSDTSVAPIDHFAPVAEVDWYSIPGHRLRSGRPKYLVFSLP